MPAHDLSNVTFDPADVDRGLLDRLNNINGTLTTQWNRLQNIRNTVEDTSTQADRARNRVRDAENLIDRARQELDKAKDAIGKVVSDVTVVTATIRQSFISLINRADVFCRTSNPPAAPEIQTT